MRKLRLSADYDCWPLWEAGEEAGNVDPEVLPLSDGLKGRLQVWAEQYDRTLNRLDPASSGFVDRQSQLRFEKEGAVLCQQLQAELGDAFEVESRSKVSPRHDGWVGA